MISVSNAYREAMNQPIRDRAYCEISIVSQGNDIGEYMHFNVNSSSEMLPSNYDAIFGKTSADKYAFLYRDYISTSGTFRLGSDDGTANSGIYSKTSDLPAYYDMSYDSLTDEVISPGITLEFDENIPTSFRLLSGSGDTWITYTQDDFELIGTAFYLYQGINVANLTLTVYEATYDRRVCLKSVKFGLSYTISTEDIKTTSCEKYASPISADLPYVNFSATISNKLDYRGKYIYDVEDEESIFSILKEGSTISESYGMTLMNGGIEWLKVGTMVVSEIEGNRNEVKITATDTLRNKTDKYWQTYDDLYPVTQSTTLEYKHKQIFERLDIDITMDGTQLRNSGNVRSLTKECTAKEFAQIICNAHGMGLRITSNDKCVGELCMSKTPSVDITLEDMMSEPLVKRNKPVRRIECDIYKDATQNTVDYSKEIDVSEADTFFEVKMEYPQYGTESLSRYNFTLNGTTLTETQFKNYVNVLVNGRIYKSMYLNATGKWKFSTVLKLMPTLTTYIEVGEEGETMRWENPYVYYAMSLGNYPSNLNAMGDSMKKYFSSKYTYEFNTRGFPEIEPLDMIRQQRTDGEFVNCIVEKVTLNYNGGFTGSLETRRMD